MSLKFQASIPVLRMFSVEKAEEFYLGFLGFTVDWRHRFQDAAPLYMQISRAGLTLHLSEHYGDGSPGAVVFVRMDGLANFHAELTVYKYGYLRPGIEKQPWGDEMTVIDPFGNRIRFCEQRQA